MLNYAKELCLTVFGFNNSTLVLALGDLCSHGNEKDGRKSFTF